MTCWSGRHFAGWMDNGSLTTEQIERLGQALIALDRQFTELRDVLTERDGT